MTTGENYLTKSFVVLYFRYVLYLGQIEEDEMGEACGMCGNKWKHMQSFDGEV